MEILLAEKLFRRGLLTVVLALMTPLGVHQAVAQDLGVNDVSILFPIPETASDIDGLIRIQDLEDRDGNAVFSKADFDQILELSGSDASRVLSRKISFSKSQSEFANWVIAGIRFDPSAPGSSAEMIDTFGSLPQIRLIIQPVSTLGTRARVQDVAIHVIYDYASERPVIGPGHVRKAVPDSAAVEAILEDLRSLKQFSEDAGVDTDQELNVHPGLAAGVDGLTGEIEDFLSEHLSASLFNSGAVMGLDGGGPEPWLFVAMFREPDITGEFQALPSPGLGSIANPVPLTSHMLSFLDFPNVQPATSTTNSNDLTTSLLLPPEQRRGVSTEALFGTMFLEGPAAIGVDEKGDVVFDPVITNADIVDIIANPEISHFFNTDCMSCHSETTRREQLEIDEGDFAYELPEGVSGLADEVVPESEWNVRNFGWFRADNTITLRTANETAEVVAFINRGLVPEAHDDESDQEGEGDEEGDDVIGD
ncbi:MAG: hypothetical protein AAF431_19340 [Pseudomonadota bacterium]